MPKMRTIKNAIKEIQSTDPQTAFTEHALRRAVITGAIPSVKAGTRYLVDLDCLERYLGNETSNIIMGK